MMVVHLDRLAPYHGAAQEEHAWEGSGGGGGLKKQGKLLGKTVRYRLAVRDEQP
jgi:hypothetical protein